MADVEIIGEYEDTVFIVRPLTDAATAWIKENVPYGDGPLHPDYPTLVVEHRYIEELLKGMRAASLTLERKD